jgi:hypothetical protein
LKTELKIGNVDRGISIIEKEFMEKKVLVILDDVDDFENLHKLVKKERLGLGSRIIVTTRDENVLSSLREQIKNVRSKNWMIGSLFDCSVGMPSTWPIQKKNTQSFQLKHWFMPDVFH